MDPNNPNNQSGSSVPPELQQYYQVPPAAVPAGGRTRKQLILILVGIVIVAILVGVGAWLLFKPSSSKAPAAQSTSQTSGNKKTVEAPKNTKTNTKSATQP